MSTTKVQSDMIDDNAVTLAKMAGGTASQNIAYDGSGDPVDAALPIATQAEMETASSAVVLVPPGRVQYHPGVAKAWAVIDQVGTQEIDASYNVSSITDTAVGRTNVHWGTDMSSIYYAVNASAGPSVANHGVEISDRATTYGSFAAKNFSSNTDGDTLSLNVVALGDQ